MKTNERNDDYWISLYLGAAANFWNGVGVPCNKMMAKDLYEKAAALGNGYANFCIGKGYEYGDFGYVDLSRAFKQYITSAEKGLVIGMAKVGEFLLFGKGCNQNFEEAFIWFKKAVEKDDDAYSMYFLGYIYFNGNGVNRNYNEAAYWFERAKFGDSAVWVKECHKRSNLDAINNID